MIISDLNYCEFLAEQTEIVGGAGEAITLIPGVSIAIGTSESIAVGGTTFTQGAVKTETATGFGSKTTATGISVSG